MSDENSVERLRLFVAITVPDAVREEMILVQRELEPLAPQGAVRWSRPEQFHLTLRFLGDVSSDRVADLQESVLTACTNMPALHLHAQGVGFFPHARSPRVIWVGINNEENLLMDLQKKIEDAVHPFTSERGNERFAGHVTLGRFKQFNRLKMKELTLRAESLKDRAFGNWTAQEIEIIRSKLLPTGAYYIPLSGLPLGKRIEPA